MDWGRASGGWAKSGVALVWRRLTVPRPSHATSGRTLKSDRPYPGGEFLEKNNVCWCSVPAVVALTMGSFGLFSSSAFASSSKGATNGTVHCYPNDTRCRDPMCEFNPVLRGPAPAFVTVSSNCPSFLSTDTWALNFVSGNAVAHGTTNKNGDWGGETAEGQAVLTPSGMRRLSVADGDPNRPRVLRRRPPHPIREAEQWAEAAQHRAQLIQDDRRPTGAHHRDLADRPPSPHAGEPGGSPQLSPVGVEMATSRSAIAG